MNFPARLLTALLVAGSTLSVASFVEARVPLVMGNRVDQNVQNSQTRARIPPTLPRGLRRSGFDMILRADLDSAGMDGTAIQFARAVHAADGPQRVLLFEEDPSDPEGKSYVGSVEWRSEPVKALDGKEPDTAVRADINVPDRKLKMTVLFHRNTDVRLPVSHTFELTFRLLAHFVRGGVSNVSGMLMKSDEQTRGAPLAGLATKVTTGFFLIGLSNADADRLRNMQLISERSWLGVLLVYNDKRRAMIAIEKGPPGERVFNDALAAWQPP